MSIPAQRSIFYKARERMAIKVIKDEIRRSLGYFFYTIIIGYILYEGTKYGINLHPINPSTYKFEPYPFYIFVLGFPIAIGLLVALPGLINNLKKGGKWYFDWVKFISVGLPTLFLAMYPLILLSKAGLLMPKEINFVLGSSNVPHTISGVAFGYLLLSVFGKHKPN